MRLIPASDASLAEAILLLRNGGVVVHATETCYGLACDLTNPTAVTKLFAIKKRASEQPVTALFADIGAARAYVEWSDEAEHMATRFLPGPLTIILPMQAHPPHSLYPTPSGGQTLGIRVSSHPIAQHLVATFGLPLSTSSANVHGEPNPYDARKILERFSKEEAKPDLILDSGTLPEVAPSTVVDLAGGRVVREGSLKIRSK